MSVIKAQNENAVSLLANEAVINKPFSLAAEFMYPCKLFVIKYRRTYNQRYVSSIESCMSFALWKQPFHSEKKHNTTKLGDNHNSTGNPVWKCIYYRVPMKIFMVWAVLGSTEKPEMA